MENPRHPPLPHPRHWHAALLASLLILSPTHAQQDPLQSLKANPTTHTIAEALPLLAEPASRAAISTALTTLDPFPAKALIELLSHPSLAVRLGALEILEEKAGGDFDYNPWASPSSPENEPPLARWQKWLAQGTTTPGSPGSLLSEDQHHSYLRDLLAEDSNRSARARRMLEADGLAAVGFLENFLSASPTLPPGSRAKIREAQYQIVLFPTFGPQAPALARELAFGNRDQTLSALSTIKSAGLSALPIIRDFLRHPDSLVRETSIDAMLSSGGSQVLDIVGPILASETDPNVIHGALRRLKEIPGSKSLKIAASFLSGEEEDLLISAIQACQKLVAGESDSYSGRNQGSVSKTSKSAKAASAAIIKTLSDPRWRVRTAALEYIAAAKVIAASEKCVSLLQDPDEFVRFSAIKAATALHAESALPVLKTMFMENPETIGPVLEGYAALGSLPDEAMMEKLAEYPPDSRIAAIRAAATESRLTFLPLHFASDPDLDVACAALRFLSADDERVEDQQVATVLVEALRSGIAEKEAAVLDQIELPKGQAPLDPELSGDLGKWATPPEKTYLDPLYDSLLSAAATSTPVEKIETIPGALSALFGEIARVAKNDGPNSFRAALSLAITGDPTGLRILLRDLSEYSTAQRAAIAGDLYSPTRKEALQLLSILVRDPVEEVRTEAVSSALSAEETAAFLTMALEALADPDSGLAPHQLYSYRFSSASRGNGSSGRALLSWASSTYADESVPRATRVLAFVALGQKFPSAAAEKTLTIAKSSPDKWIRRAAWFALGSSSSQLFSRHTEDLVSDPSPFVRAVLPEITGRMDSAWQHRFDDVNAVSNSSWYSNRSSRRLSRGQFTALEALAATDPSPDVRFEAAFALLSHGKEINADEFAILLRSRSEKEDSASTRIATWMEENIGKIGPGLAPVASALDPTKVDPADMAKIAAKVSAGKKRGAGFTSFSALAANAQDTGEAPQQTASSGEETEEITRESLKVVYFYKPGCEECEEAARLLEVIRADFPLLEIDRHNINETTSTLYNQALCARFNVPTPDHQIAPALFTQADFLIRDDISPQALGKLLASTMKLSQDDSWSELNAPELDAAKKQVERRYESLTLPVVLLAGLIDGVNPCAFATIIFFLSYLQIARRTPREMLAVGIAFILAVFLAYFAAGLVLHSILEQMTDRIAGIKPYLDWGFAGLAVIAAVISFRDAAKARSGKLDEMALTLPGFLKDRIRGVIRTGARARRFVIAAFIAGILISFLELACTGQVYAPIIYSIQQGRVDAVAWLFAYNLAFILPLIIIFALAFCGMSNKTLVDFQTRHTFSVKIALGLVFLALAAVIIWSAAL